MPSSRRTVPARLDPRRPLVFNIRPLPRRPGSARAEELTVPAPADLGAGMVRVPQEAALALRLRFESVTEGVLVTADITAPVTGECARCLEPLASTVDVRCQELFSYGQDDGEDGDAGYALDGDLLDLEPALRDALVLALPLAPLCRDDCPGLCAECGARLAEAGPEHGHEDAVDPRWAALRERMTQSGLDGPSRAADT